MRRLSLYLAVVLLVMAMFCISVGGQSPSGVVKLDPSIDQILSADSKLEFLKGEGSFESGEGPLWIQHGESGYLLFSDVSGNRIMQWTPDFIGIALGRKGVMGGCGGYRGEQTKNHHQNTGEFTLHDYLLNKNCKQTWTISRNVLRVPYHS
jgi:sugar lactone lactonase YvrE